MKVSEYLSKFEPKQFVTVHGNVVWDYKDNEDHTELRLISEPVAGVESFEKVTAEELYEFVGVFADTMKVVDETTGKEIKSV